MTEQIKSDVGAATEHAPPAFEKRQLEEAAQSVKTDSDIPADILEILPKLPVGARKTVLQAVTYVGPIPPPAMMRQYDEAVPGLGGQIVAWADRQHNHRIGLETMATSGAERRMDRAQSNSFWIGLVAIIVAGATAIWGNPWAAGIIACVGIGGPNAATALSRILGKGPYPIGPHQSAPPAPNHEARKTFPPRNHGRKSHGSAADPRALYAPKLLGAMVLSKRVSRMFT